MPCRVKSISDRKKRESVKSKQGQGPLTILQGAPFSSILHAGACLKPLLHDSLHGQLGFAVQCLQARLSLLTIHKPCDANPSAPLILHSICHNCGLDSTRTVPSAITVACNLHNL